MLRRAEFIVPVDSPERTRKLTTYVQVTKKGRRRDGAPDKENVAEQGMPAEIDRIVLIEILALHLSTDRILTQSASSYV